MDRDHFWLNERQFARLTPHLPTDTRGKPRVDDRRVISGIVHVLKSGCRWADAPLVYGPRKTLYNRFVRWAAKGVWLDIFHVLAAAGGPPAEVLIDSSAVKAHRCASGGKGGNTIRRSRRRPPEDREQGSGPQHTAQSQSTVEELLLTVALSSPQRDRAHVRTAQGLSPDRNPLRPPRT